jgi:hypothetical protein
MIVKLATSSTITQVTLHDTIYTPGMNATLISMGKLNTNRLTCASGPVSSASLRQTQHSVAPCLALTVSIDSEALPPSGKPEGSGWSCHKTKPEPNQSRQDQTRPKDNQSTRAPLFLKPEGACNVFFIINLRLNNQFFSSQNNKTKPEHQSLPVLLMACHRQHGLQPQSRSMSFIAVSDIGTTWRC